MKSPALPTSTNPTITTSTPSGDSLLDRIRRDREHRQQQHQVELERFEKELAIRRAKRQAERAGDRAMEEKTTAVMDALTDSAIANSLQTMQVRVTKEKVVHHQLQVEQRDRNAKLTGDRAMFQLREQRLQQWKWMRSRKRKPAPVKKYVVQHEDFYGADFAPATTAAEQTSEELWELGKLREAELMNNPDRINLFMEKGEALVKALEEMRHMSPERVETHALSLRQDQQQDLSEKLSQQLVVRVTGPAGSSSTTHSSTSSHLAPRHESSSSDLARFFDAPMSGTDLARSHSSDLSSNGTGLARKKWMEFLPKPRIDFSDYFTANVGMKEGLTVYRIEDLRPTLVPPQKHHQLCLGDCYIILHTFEAEDGHGTLDHRIYQWIGERVSLDKKACSAIFAVGLRNHLNVVTEVRREQAREESEEFLTLFLGQDEDLQYVEATQAAPSGLFKVQATEYPLRIYRVMAATVERHGEQLRKVGNDFSLLLVEPSPDSLKSGHSYLIDNGLQIYQWNGKDAPLNDRTKCRLLAEKICKSERPSGKARVDHLEENHEPPEFWNVFDGRKRPKPVLRLHQTQNEERSAFRVPTLFVFDADYAPNSAADLDINEQIRFPTDASTSTRPSRKLLHTSACAVLDCGNELYFWVGKKSSHRLRQLVEHLLIAHIFPRGGPRPAYIATGKFMETVEPEVFKARFQRWDEELVRSLDFTSHGKKGGSSTNGSENKLANLAPTPAIKVDVQALYTPPPTGKISHKEERFMEELLEKGNRLLETLQCFLFDNTQKVFVRLPEWSMDGGREAGHFWSEDSYVFLCVYKREQQQQKKDDEALTGTHLGPSEPRKLGDARTADGSMNLSRGSLRHVNEAELVSSRECVLYFWCGADTPQPPFAKLTFLHQFKGQMEQLIRDASNGKMQTRTVILEQGRESIALLSHFRGECVIHKGSHPVEFTVPFGEPPVTEVNSTPRVKVVDLDKIHLYHLRTEAKYKMTRGIEVTPMKTSLVSRDTFVLTSAGYNGIEPPSPENTFVWIGKGASKEEERRAVTWARRLVSFSVSSGYRNKDDLFTVIKESREPLGFWKMLGPNFHVPTASQFTVPKGQEFYYCSPPPRLFRCSTETGHFAVTNVGIHYQKSDLQPTSICFLDAAPGLGRPFLIWVWLGVEVSDVLTKFSKKALDCYLTYWNDGRTLENSPWQDAVSAAKRSASMDLLLPQMKPEGELPRRKPAATARRANADPDVRLVYQGSEPVEFKAFFHGWGDTFRMMDASELVETSNVKVQPCARLQKPVKAPPSNAFLREQQQAVANEAIME